LGGYAVVHPSGRVCGVIVATSADPYGNGGTMPVEYMGCPAGSKIVFQTKPSPSGNVAGWHGENVYYNGSEFLIKSSNNDSSTVQTTIQSGVATDSNGRVWDTGSGATIKPGITPISDTRTVTVDTQTATMDSKTATTSSTGTSSSDSTPLEVKTAIPDPATVQRITNNLSAKVAEAQLIAKVISSKQSSIQVNTDFSNSLLQISATKKGIKPMTFLVETNSKGDAKLTVKKNLSGYTVTLAAGATKLDVDKIKG
jgi:hypothetical protein